MKNKLINSAFIFMAIGLTCFSSFAASPGSLDPSFGVAGESIPISPTSFQQLFADMSVMDDGRIVAVLRSSVDFATIRCKSDGTLDNTFGNNGIVLTDLGSTNDEGVNVAIQSDGKIVVLAENSSNSATILRFNFNGSLDTTFDTDGKKPLGVLNGSGIAIKSDGKIVVSASNGDFIVVQLNPDGSFDTTFDGDGILTTNIDSNDKTSDVSLQTDGKIVVVGTVANDSKSAIVRYNVNGSLDTTFSGDGILINDFFTDTSREVIDSFAINPVNNSIVVVGEANGIKMQVYCVLTNGNFDTSFSGDGRFELDFQSNGDEVVIQSDGKIVVAGSKKLDSNTTLNGILLIRLNVNGTLDTQFGNNGIKNISSQNGNGGGQKSISLNGDKLTIGNFGFRLNAVAGFARINLSNTPTANSDFDGDGFTDAAVFRPSTGNWFILQSSNGTVQIPQFGVSGDIPIDGDFDGDGRSDLAIYRPGVGQWWLQRSSDNSVFATTFGIASDNSTAGDFDRDGKTDIAVFRPSTGQWLILRSSANFSTFFSFPFGSNGDIPISKKGL
jgi:uncharacterized delta-60 repeat protein